MEGSDGDVTPGGRRTPEQTRAEILDAARAFLWDHPFRELTVGGLMDTTSVGRSTFYIHFSDVYELAAALLEELDAELELATRPGRSRVEFPQNVDETLAAAVALWKQNGPVLRAIAEASAQHGELDDLYRQGFVQRAVDRVCVPLAQAQERGVVDPAIDVHETSIMLILMLDHYMLDRLGRHPQADTDVLLTTVVTAWRRILGLDA